MAVVSKQLIKLFYGKEPVYAYWNGCSTGGRQGQAMAQRFPDDYQGILAGAPAIHFEKLGLGQTWPHASTCGEEGLAGRRWTDRRKLVLAQPPGRSHSRCCQ